MNGSRVWAALGCAALVLLAGFGGAGSGAAQQVSAAMFSDAPIGFASVDSLGQNGTTGGKGGPTVTVSSAAELASALARPGPLIIRVNGMIALGGRVDLTSDKTLIGMGAESGLRGGGLGIGLRNTNTQLPAGAIKNVIVRNLVLTQCPDDCINIQEFSHHIWIDHNDLSFETDGALDIKRAADFITVSWNHFHDSDKNMLVGHSDSNAAQDVGRLRVTVHNNWFDGTVQRNPRVRFGEPVHVLNNYYSDVTSYGVASQQNAGVLVEANFFENTRMPTRTDVGGGPGRIALRANALANSDRLLSVGSVLEPARFYDYPPLAAEQVPATVRAGAGVGKLDL